MRTKILVITMIWVLWVPFAAKATLIDSNSIVEDGIEYYMQTDKSVYDLGENVEMLFRVTNLREEDVTISCSRSPEFNLLVQQYGENIWMKTQGWYWDMPPVPLAAGEYVDLTHTWDMKDNNGNLVGPGSYDVVGLMYNEPWNYDNGGPYIPTEAAVSITIMPEPSSLALFVISLCILTARRQRFEHMQNFDERSRTRWKGKEK